MCTLTLVYCSVPMHTTYLLTCGSEGRDGGGPAVGRREAHRLGLRQGYREIYGDIRRNGVTLILTLLLGLLQEDARPLAIASARGVTGAGLEVDTQRGARLDLG